MPNATLVCWENMGKVRNFCFELWVFNLNLVPKRKEIFESKNKLISNIYSTFKIKDTW